MDFPPGFSQLILFPGYTHFWRWQPLPLNFPHDGQQPEVESQIGPQHHCFGGGPLAAFLKARVPVELRQRFSEQVFASSVFRIDFAEVVFLAVKTSMRHSVTAMLAGWTEPIRLSRLMDLLHRTAYDPAL